jgi:penicillin-binding protein 1A
MLRGVVRNGTGKAAGFDASVRGKTGTSNDYRDAWFIGFSGDMVAGFWVGNDAATPMLHVAGGGVPAQTFRRYGANVSGVAERREARARRVPQGRANR